MQMTNKNFYPQNGATYRFSNGNDYIVDEVVNLWEDNEQQMVIFHGENKGAKYILSVKQFGDIFKYVRNT